MTLEELYRDLHRHPELAFQEHRTAAAMAHELNQLGFETCEGIGRTGIVGRLRRGDGPSVLLRAELDALPICERTGVSYAAASDGPTVAMHACGHDLHVCWVLGAAAALARRTDWAGTIIALGQPAEETGDGAEAMIDDGLFDRIPLPDVLLAQHVSPAPVGTFSTTGGLLLAGSQTVTVRFGGADPLRRAALFVNALDTLRTEVAPHGTLRELSFTAGDQARRQAISPDAATVRLVIRFHSNETRSRIMGGLTDLADDSASLTISQAIPPVINDPSVTRCVLGAVEAELGPRSTMIIPPAQHSDDFSRLAAKTAAPSVYSYVGGGDPDAWMDAMRGGDRAKVIANHSPYFLPVQGSLAIGIRCYVASALAFLRQ